MATRQRIHSNSGTALIQISNLVSGEVLSYSLPLLIGEVCPLSSQGSIVVKNPASKSSLSWPIRNGHFKALVPLQPGSNSISLHFFDDHLDFDLCFQAPARPFFIRPVLIKACDDDGSIQGPIQEDTSAESAQQRIALGAKILQSFTAEKMYEHGLGRKTFALECDLSPKSPACHLFTSQLTIAKAHSMPGGELWLHFAKELVSSKPSKDREVCKWFAFMSFTRYQPPKNYLPKSHSEIMNNTKGHTALGGGGLALYGSGNMHTWATSLEEFVPRFTDNRKIDRKVLMDDSAYREFHWANYSTSLGASLHELGHTLDLAHTPTGVMARGFDDLYRVFLVHQMNRSSHSQEGSRLASPVPYSPRQSPVRRKRPNLCSNSPQLPRSVRSTTPNQSAIVYIEPSFQKMHLNCSQTMVLKNYDGSETRRTITRHRESLETVNEITLHAGGEQVVKEVIRHLATGKTRTTMSMSTTHESLASLGGSLQNSTSSLSSCHSQHSLHKPSSPCPSSLPESPEDECVGGVQSAVANGNHFNTHSLTFQELRYKDGGAHWYRSSAVLLTYHRWFNDPRPDDPGCTPILNGCLLQCPSGLRLVELRSLPDGVVLHHWEFLHNRPPVAFRLGFSEISRFCDATTTEIGVLAIEEYGRIVKKKVSLQYLKDAEMATNGN